MKKYIIGLFILSFCYISIPALAEEPLMISTDTEDISLTDDIDVARAQVAKYPDNAEAHFNLAIALSRTSYVEDSIKELRKTKKLIRRPENEGLIDKKITEYKEILKDHEDDSTLNNIRYRLAFSHYLKAYYISKEIEKREKFEKEQKEKEQNINPEKKKSKKGLSIDLLGSQKLIQIDKDPKIKESLEQSIHYFKDVLRLNPNDEWTKIYYGFILAEQLDEVNKAKKLWKEVVKENPNNPAPYFFLGELKIKEGNLKEGLMEISQAILLRSLGN